VLLGHLRLILPIRVDRRQSTTSKDPCRRQILKCLVVASGSVPCRIRDGPDSTGVLDPPTPPVEAWEENSYQARARFLLAHPRAPVHPDVISSLMVRVIQLPDGAVMARSLTSWLKGLGELEGAR